MASPAISDLREIKSKDALLGFVAEVPASETGVIVAMNRFSYCAF